MNSFILRLEHILIEIEFISDHISVTGGTFYNGEAFQKHDFNSTVDPTNRLFSFSFVRDTANWNTARSFKVQSSSEELNSLVRGYFQDKIMLGIKRLEEQYISQAALNN